MFLCQSYSCPQAESKIQLQIQIQIQMLTLTMITINNSTYIGGSCLEVIFEVVTPSVFAIHERPT
jgi:hypothetical protein